MAERRIDCFEMHKPPLPSLQGLARYLATSTLVYRARERDGACAVIVPRCMYSVARMYGVLRGEDVYVPVRGEDMYVRSTSTE